jgi:AcrR family transcriptional regulator
MTARADARRNRELLLSAAAQAFAVAEGQVSLEAIARSAGVGIGTLYRHYPTREALVEAVYRAELAEVAASAEKILADTPPLEALRRWIQRYTAFVSTKQGMAETLRAVFDSGALERSETREGIVGAVEVLLKAGAADGSLRQDVAADDVVSSLLGIFLASSSPDQTQRMIELLIDGLVVTR